MKKISMLASVLLSISAVGVANAAVITYGGVSAGDGSGLTSQFMDPTQAALADPQFGFNNYFIETFDSDTQMAGQGAGSVGNNEAPADGCAINSTAAGITVTGSFGVGIGNIPGRAAPDGDATCFGYTPGTGDAASGSVIIDYSNFLDLIGPQFKINYVGFYWGSADRYNTLNFFNGDTQVASLDGETLLGANNGQSGNRVDPGSNVYVNIAFGAGDEFDRIELVSTSRAMEVDNIVIGITQVPEPAGIAVLGLMLLGVRRFSKR